VEGNTNNQLTQWEKDNASRLASEAEGSLKNIVPDWNAISSAATDPANYISGQAIDQYHLYNNPGRRLINTIYITMTFN
jgi:hypothetical protein